MTAPPPSKSYRPATAANPAPAAVRCPTPGCYRRRCPSPTCLSGMTALCHRCHADAPRRGPRPPTGGGPASGGAYEMTAAVWAEVWTLAACRASSTVPPEWREVPAGTRVVAVGRPSKSDEGGDPVVELACGGRFVCPPHVMKLMGVKS